MIARLTADWLKALDPGVVGGGRAFRGGIPEGPRKLVREYIQQGRLGVKSSRDFYEHMG